jgi:hypothetical protein
MSSYYDVLGVGVDADVEDVRRAYLRKAQQLHPDRFAGSPEPERRRAETEMKVLNEAWNTLKSAEGRRRYDIEHGLVAADLDDGHLGAGSIWDESLWDDAEAPTRPSLFRRTGVRLAIVVVIVAAIAGSGVVVLSRPANHSASWSRTETADMRSAAINAGLTAPQADCFVASITRRYSPSDDVDRSVIQQAIDSCRSR